MKRIFALAVLVLLVCSLFACGTAETVYTVTVVNAAGEAMTGITVQPCTAENCLKPLKTDENGRVRFTLPEGDDITAYEIKLTLPEGNSYEPTAFTAGQSALTVRVREVTK